MSRRPARTDSKHADYTPRIEWALFAERAERDDLGFLNLSQVRRWLPRIPGEPVGIRLSLVFGLSTTPHSTTMVQLTVLWPQGDLITSPVRVAVKDAHFADVVVKFPSVPVHEVGMVRVEFRLNDQAEPNYVTQLAILDTPFSLVRG
ncbi:MAG: hypothetical protein ABJA98_17570 [Acidobacteriota bacterium]